MKRRIISEPIDIEKIAKIAAVVMVLLLLVILLVSYLSYRKGISDLFILWASLSGYIAVFYLYLVNLLRERYLNQRNKQLRRENLIQAEKLTAVGT